MEDGASQFGGISLQIIKEISAKPVWTNIAFPSRDDLVLSPDAQEIGPCIAGRTAIASFIAAVANASFEWPSPTHLRIILSLVPKKQERDAF